MNETFLKRRAAFFRRRWLTPALLSCLWGCAPTGFLAPAPSVWPPPAPTQTSVSELQQKLSEYALGAKSFSGKADLSYRGADGDLKALSVRLAADKPQQLYLKGYRRMLPTFFTLVGNSEGTWLEVPSKKTTYHLPVGVELSQANEHESLRALRPRDLLRALVPDPPHQNEEFVLTSASDGHALLAVDKHSRQPTRRLVFDPAELVLREVSEFDSGGLEVMRARYHDYHESNGLRLPHSVIIERPVIGVAIEFAFETVRARQIAPKIFAFEPSAHHQLVELTDNTSELPDLAWPEQTDNH